ncbi:MAG: hypothetical protein ACTJHU_11415 [Mycetocola sp.]
MSRSRRQSGTLSFLICLVGPLALGVLLNAVVRPALAASLNGERRTVGSSARSHNGWWEFTASVREEHLFLTDFLTASDGQVAVIVLGLTVGALATRAVILRVRRSLARKAPAILES